MENTSKIKSRIVAVVFLIVLILPVCYALIRHYFFSETDVNKGATQTEQTTK